MELLQLLTSQLGVSQQQAQGGAGLLFKMAQDQLGSGDFSKIANVVPGIEGMMGAAPKPSGLGGALGMFASSFGGTANQLGSLASLASGFKDLKLDADMIGRFVPIVLSFVQSQGGDTVKNLLEKVLK